MRVKAQKNGTSSGADYVGGRSASKPDQLSSEGREQRAGAVDSSQGEKRLSVPMTRPLRNSRIARRNAGCQE